ncbi:MAG: hypothetical protein QNJ55_10225 [Xenococcus sp. MO_188.B8]|nr:hypothetical protein [Xenococcus sp. MO_188.B8]
MAQIMERTKEQALQEQVLQKYRRLERLEKFAREGLPLDESEEKELMELQLHYAHFMLQPEVVRLITPAFEDFLRQAREGNLPTRSDIAKVIIPILLEAADNDRIFIPHNPGIVGSIACLLMDFCESLKQGSQLILKIFTGVGASSGAVAGELFIPPRGNPYPDYSYNRMKREENND